MAEGAVSFVVEKLGNLLIQEAVAEGAFLHGVGDQTEWVKSEMKRMQCFLKDADAKGRKGDERVKNWVCDVRGVAYQVEDVLDTVMLMIEKRCRRRGFIGSLSRYAHIPEELITRHKVGVKIERIKNMIREINDSRAAYGIANLGESGDEGSRAVDDSLQARRRLFPHFDDETDHVGVEDAKKALLKQLLDGGNLRRCVISIIGMGGLGKTTLANRIYNSPDVKRCFDKSAWVSVSQDYNVMELWKDVFKQVTGITEGQSKLLKDTLKKVTGITKEDREWLRDILKKVTGITKEESERMGEKEVRVKLYEFLQVTDNTEKVKEEEVRVKIYEFLKGVRYLVVLDDVWADDVWSRIHNVFPNTNNGSRVVLTTRNIEVAKSADPSTPPHQLRFLNDEESWQLFCKKAFPRNEDGETRYPQELEGLGRRLTKKCGGLPLALVVLGGLLSRKEQTYPVWLQVDESMDWESTGDGHECLEVLGGLSYDALPHHYLKSCFLYIGAFPEDTEIPTSRLIRLWVAEGFIPQRPKQTMEETARGYLDELVLRCMIQVAKRSLAHGWAKTIRIHDLLRDLCTSEARKGEFLEVRGSHTDSSTSRSPYRVALHNYTFNEHPISLPNVRTLLCYNPYEQVGFARPFSRFKSLRVFDLGAAIDLAIPRGIMGRMIGPFVLGFLGRQLNLIPRGIMGRMIHLRYLRISGSSVRLLSSIGSLCNLITLDLQGSMCPWVPDELWKIRTLRNLYFRWESVKPPTSFCLENLQVLIGVGAGEWIGRSLGKHTNLRKLLIHNIRTSHHKELLTSLRKFDRLMSLKLYSFESILTEEVLTVFPNQHHLHVMLLCGKLSKLPASSEFPPNLTKLTLYFSDLEQDPMPTLEKLPNLVCLHLFNPYVGKSMSCSAGGFPRLQHLSLNSLLHLEAWRVEGGAMPNLTHLTIDRCWDLKMLPEGLHQVTTLQELKLLQMTEELKGRVREGDGEDWYKIQHVPSITIE